MELNKTPRVSRKTQDILAMLASAEKILRSNFVSISKRGSSAYVRDAMTSLALIQALQTYLGAEPGEAPAVLMASLLGMTVLTTYLPNNLNCHDRRVFRHHSSP